MNFSVVIKQDLDGNKEALRTIQRNLKEMNDIELSRVRMLDILLWMKKKKES